MSLDDARGKMEIMAGLPETLDLGALGIDPAAVADVALIHEANGSAVYRLRSGRRRMVIKWFADEPEPAEPSSYVLLGTLGVPTLPVYGRSDNVMVLEDLSFSATWRLATEADCECAEVGRAVARWYRHLHEVGRELLAKAAAPAFGRREEDGLDPKTILAMGQKLGLGHLSVWRLCNPLCRLCSSSPLSAI